MSPFGGVPASDPCAKIASTVSGLDGVCAASGIVKNKATNAAGSKQAAERFKWISSRVGAGFDVQAEQECARRPA